MVLEKSRPSPSSTEVPSKIFAHWHQKWDGKSSFPRACGVVPYLRAKGPDLVVPRINLTRELAPIMCLRVLSVLPGESSAAEAELTDWMDISHYLKLGARPGLPWYHSFDSKISRGSSLRCYCIKAILTLATKNYLNRPYLSHDKIINCPTLHNIIYMCIKGEMSESVLTGKQRPPFGSGGQAGTKLSGRLLDTSPLSTPCQWLLQRRQPRAMHWFSVSEQCTVFSRSGSTLEMLCSCAGGVCIPCASSKKFP